MLLAAFLGGVVGQSQPLALLQINFPLDRSGAERMSGGLRGGFRPASCLGGEATAVCNFWINLWLDALPVVALTYVKCYAHPLFFRLEWKSSVKK